MEDFSEIHFPTTPEVKSDEWVTTSAQTQTTLSNTSGLLRPFVKVVVMSETTAFKSKPKFCLGRREFFGAVGAARFFGVMVRAAATVLPGDLFWGRDDIVSNENDENEKNEYVEHYMKEVI